jgi:haloalkane dehalogenase
MPDVSVLDSTMHYEEAGEGDPIVLLHGNPTSSFLWRKVIPGVGGEGRVLAPDLIGHARYLDAWFDALALERVGLAATPTGSRRWRLWRRS